MNMQNQHQRLFSSPYYTPPPVPPKPKRTPFVPYRGSFGLWRLQLPDGTEKGPFVSRKVARKSITFYRREWEAAIAAKELPTAKRKGARKAA